MNTENNNTAVIYARVSSIGDRQNTERQVSDLSALVIQKGLSIEKVYEEHVSGAKKNSISWPFRISINKHLMFFRCHFGDPSVILRRNLDNTLKISTNY